MRKISSLFLLAICLLLAAGCSRQSNPVVSPAQATPTIPSLDLKPCFINSTKADCGYLSVPEDRNNPGGRTLNLKIVVVRASEPNPAPDPLFYIPGGPGNYATGDAANARTIFAEVNTQRDIVYLDQRGTNESHRLTCDAIPFDVLETPQQQLDDWMRQCLASLDGDPRFYMTVPAMLDLDQARAALGYDKINLFGMSYGAMAVQVYMRMFPEHVRAVVIDHGTALDLPFATVFARASQSALDQVFAYCAQDAKCHAAYPDISDDWQAVVNRLAKGPVVTSYIPPGESTPYQMTLVDLAVSAHTTMYASNRYGMIPYVVHALAVNEDWTQIIKSLNDQTPPPSAPQEGFLLMKNMIFCFEPAWGFLPDQIPQIARLGAGSYYSDVETRVGQQMQRICAALPKPDPSLIYGPGKPAPLSALALNSVLDPQNPPSNMDLALKEFTKSRVVVEPTEGHDTSNSPCRWRIIAQYIEQGSVDGLDTACMQEQKPSFITP